MNAKHWSNTPPGTVLWLTGLSGAGKTTIACALHAELTRRHLLSAVLDGDEVREGLSSDLGFSEKDRGENNRRVAEVAKLMAKAQLIVIAALISPYRSDRQRVRDIVADSGGVFFEVFVDTPLAICEQRDVKGHYKRARERRLANFTGIDVPYERPTSPDILVCPANESIQDSVTKVMTIVWPELVLITDPGCMEDRSRQEYKVLSS